MKIAKYPTSTPGVTHDVEYDETAPCWCCGEPVMEASMAGTMICPACDCGYHRSGRKLYLCEVAEHNQRWKQNVDKYINNQESGLVNVVKSS